MIGNEEVLVRVQGLSVSLFVRDEPVNLAPYFVYTSPNSAGMMPVREDEGVVVGSRFGIYWVDADRDSDLIPPDETVWLGIGRYREWNTRRTPRWFSPGKGSVYAECV